MQNRENKTTKNDGGLAFSIKFGFFSLLVLGILAAFGFYAHTRLVEFATEDGGISAETRMLAIEGVANNLMDAELSVEAYKLNENTEDLDRFYLDVMLAEVRMSHLKTYGYSTHLTDTLSALVNEKFSLLNERLALGDQFRVKQAMDQVIHTIRENQSKPDLLPDSVLNDKQPWFKKIFLSRAEKDSIQQTKIKTQLFNKLEADVKKVKSKEVKIETGIKQQETKLIANTRTNTRKANAILDELRKTEMQKMQIEAKAKADRMQKLNEQFTQISFIIGGVLILIVIITISYFRSTSKLNKSLAKSKAETEAVSKAKIEFVNQLSHEIKTPVHAIAGFAQLLSASSIDPEQQKHLSVIQQSAAHLSSLVSDNLDFSKLKAGKIHLHSDTFCPSQVTHEVCQLLEQSVEEKGLTIELTDHTNAANVVGDALRLRQMLLNLLSNAVKFTSSGSITITISSNPIELHNTQFIWQIQDNGPGLSDAELSQVFEAYEQANKDQVLALQGTGLGLPITRQLAELHGGKCWLENNESDKGLSAFLEIPYGLVQEDSANVETPLPMQLPEHLTVLVADDHSFNRLLIEQYLRPYDVTIVQAENGHEAINQAESKAFDVVLIDLKMPNFNGYEVLEHIRKGLINSHTPALLLTAAELDNQQQSSTLFNGVLTKPFSAPDLIKAVLLCLNDKSETNDISAQIDFEKFKQSLNNDMSFYIEMLKAFIDGNNNGIQEITAAIKKSDVIAIEEIAHKLKSPCPPLGAVELYRLLDELEKKANTLSDQQLKQSVNHLIQKLQEANQMVEAKIDDLGGHA